MPSVPSTAMALVKPKKITVKRSEFRDNMRSFLSQSIGYTVVVLTGEDDDKKCILDNRYFEELLHSYRALVETLEITADPELYGKLLRAAETFDEDLQTGKLHSFEEAFEEET